MVTLILLPGMDGTGLLFQDFVEALDADVRTVVVSYPKNESLNYAALESTVLYQVPMDEPYVLLAESFSGPVAISIAASCPPRLLGVVLCCSFARNPQPMFSSWVRSFRSSLPSRSVPSAARLFWEDTALRFCARI